VQLFFEKFTTEDAEKKNFRFIKCSVNSVVASSQKECPWIIEWVNTMRAQRVIREATFSQPFYLKLFSVFLLRSTYFWLWLICDGTFLNKRRIYEYI